MIDGYEYEEIKRTRDTLFIFTDPDDETNKVEVKVSDSEMDNKTFTALDLAYGKVLSQLNEVRIARLTAKTPLQRAEEEIQPNDK